MSDPFTKYSNLFSTSQKFIGSLFLIGWLVFYAAVAKAEYPDRPVRLVVGFAPGGSDNSARIIAQRLSQIWGQQIFIDNKPGAAGNIGADFVSKAPADGYTLLLCVNSYTINTTAYRNLSWDLMRDFAPVGLYASSPMVVVVNEKNPAHSLSELVAYAKAHNNQLNYGSAGTGTAPHLAVEQFSHSLGLNMTHIPYKGSAPSVTALLSDEVQLAFGAQSAFDAFIKSGKLRALAVTTAQRQESAPDLPTIREALKIDFDADIWYGLLAPAKTPAAVIRKINEDLRKILNEPETQARLRSTGVLPSYLSAEDMGSLMHRDVNRWRGVIQRIKLSLD
jgi:tripartite-type tricarboxylate transporter receptor subunit TctC